MKITKIKDYQVINLNNISKGKKGKKINPMTEQHKKNISLAKKKNHPDRCF